MSNIALRLARRIVISIVGFTVLAIGIAMIALPGPAFIVIPAGLGILGLEFAWARRWLQKVKEKAEDFYFKFEKAPTAIRLDPDFILLAKTSFSPPRAMLLAQLADKEDVVGRLLAIDALKGGMLGA
jgi:uncharacterized protein (TIGR02611 family)